MGERDMDCDVARTSAASQHSTALPGNATSGPRLRALLSAYACEPDKGSEAAVGWNWAKQAARYHDVWVITRSSNRKSIEEQLRVDAEMANVRWMYYDLPRFLRGWKRQRRGLHLYYVLWQFAIFRMARQAHRSIGFELVHHVTFATYWMPSFLVFLGVPFVWGPVGGGESAPRRFYSTLSMRGQVQEYARDLVRWCAERTPLLRAIARSADLVFATTNETASALGRLGASPVQVLSQVGLSGEERAHFATVPIRHSQPFRVLSLGNLLALKGFHLSLAAFARIVHLYPDSEYWFVGDGPERLRLEHLARTLGVLPNVRFVGQIPRSRVPEILGNCDVLVHPSLHDSGGYALAEAMACGRPVVCLDLGGPGALVDTECGIKISACDPTQVQRDLAHALQQLAENQPLRFELGAGARRAVAARCDWDSKGDFVYGECARKLAGARSDAA
jgi:glycosyltransferase involved in cell wall biosynthesis